MAGIGFVLRELDRKDTLSSTASALMHGTVVAAGPWIFTVTSLALIQRGTSSLVSADASADFRGVVMYAFAISLLASAPFVNVSVRLAADDLYRRSLDGISARLVASLYGGVFATAILATLVYTLAFSMSGANLLVSVASAMVVAMIWPVLSFCGAVRDYRAITFGFAAGMLVSIVGTIWVARNGFGEMAMTVAFLLGVAVAQLVLTSRVFIAYPVRAASFAHYLAQMLKGLRWHWMLAAGSFFAVAAIWADKWVMWFGPASVRLSNGLVSAPLYDGAMFLAYLHIIPALGLFVTAIETSFFERSRRLFHAIEDKAPLGRLETLAADLERQTYRILHRTLLPLGVICLSAMLLSPSIIDIVGLQYQQLGIFRIGVLAVMFQFIFLTASSLVLFLDRQARFLMLQLIFFVMQIGLTIATIALGRDYFGYGHLLACTISAVAAMAVLERTLSKVLCIAFISPLHASYGRREIAPARSKPVRSPAKLWDDEPPPVALAQRGPLLRPRPRTGGFEP